MFISSVIASSTVVSPSLALVIFMIVIVMARCACIVTIIKGQWLWLIARLATSGMACLYSAFLPPKPGSL